ncbi:MAG: hypothetical protein A2Y02_03130 [Omnitrophica bacterium GWA2_52_12]|nr:MAG: hypothetical protein A2Y02_03130 [Omnitrophica bacterium GWA2_52_12]
MSLDHDHTTSAIAQRLAMGPKHSYLRDFVYGGVDGAVTTFAVVAGAAGAGLGAAVVLIFGAANLIGDGFSMAAGNFLATQIDRKRVLKLRSVEEAHIRDVPEGEREEVRQIFAAKGFSGEVLEKVVSVITSDPKLWVDTMLREEWGLSLETPSPLRAAGATFAAFFIAGAIPLLPFAADFIRGSALAASFYWSAGATAAVFFLLGAAKSRFTGETWFRSGFETLLVGCAAALMAYIAGDGLEHFLRGHF